LHRVLAFRAGLLDRLDRMSAVDRDFGHHRFLTYEQWTGLFQREGFVVARAEGLYLKPFTTAQIASLGLAEGVYKALGEVAAQLPQISNTCFFELRDP